MLLVVGLVAMACPGGAELTASRARAGEDAAAERSAADRPSGEVSWAQLRFVARKLIFTASTTMSVELREWERTLEPLHSVPQGGELVPRGSRVAVVRVDTDLPFGRDETTTSWLDPVTGAVLQSEKLRHGRKASWQLRRYLQRGYLGLRASPQDRAEIPLGPEGWTGRSSSTTEWPHAAPEGVPVTDSYALLYLISAGRLDTEGAGVHVCVSVKGRLVEIRFTAGELEMENVSFEELWRGGSRRRRGQVGARVVRGSGRVVGSNGDGSEVDIGFLGMRGEITALVEAGTGLPLEVRGRTKDFGELRVRLEEVRLARAPGTRG